MPSAVERRLAARRGTYVHAARPCSHVRGPALFDTRDALARDGTRIIAQGALALPSGTRRAHLRGCSDTGAADRREAIVRCPRHVAVQGAGLLRPHSPTMLLSSPRTPLSADVRDLLRGPFHSALLAVRTTSARMWHAPRCFAGSLGECDPEQSPASPTRQSVRAAPAPRHSPAAAGAHAPPCRRCSRGACYRAGVAREARATPVAQRRATAHIRVPARDTSTRLRRGDGPARRPAAAPSRSPRGGPRLSKLQAPRLGDGSRRRRLQRPFERRACTPRRISNGTASSAARGLQQRHPRGGRRRLAHSPSITDTLPCDGCASADTDGPPFPHRRTVPAPPRSDDASLQGRTPPRDVALAVRNAIAFAPIGSLGGVARR